MKKAQIAAQLYTLRDYLKTPADIAETLKKVKEIGYDSVQVSGMGPIDEAELVKILDSEGLVCCATHEAGAEIADNPEKVVERLQKLGCKYTAYPYPHLKLDSEENVRKVAASLNKSGEIMANAGITLTYHNHAIEFMPFEGSTILDFIYNETDPRFLQGEIDTYWVQAGGGDPVQWCEKLSGRLPLLHLKDYGIVDSKPAFFEIGYGNLDWDRIIPAAEDAGTEWFIVEEDTCRFDPFVSLKMSCDYLKSIAED